MEMTFHARASAEPVIAHKAGSKQLAFLVLLVPHLLLLPSLQSDSG